MSSWAQRLKRPPHELFGFAVGFGSFYYADRYGTDPPPFVRDNAVLMAGHNGLVEAKALFQSLGQKAWRVMGLAPDVSAMREKLKEAGAAYERGDTNNCRALLCNLFVTAPSSAAEELVRTGVLDEDDATFLQDAVPQLVSSGVLPELEAIVILNWMFRSEKTCALVETHPECVVELPLRVLKSGGDGGELLLACSLLTHAAAAAHSKLEEAKYFASQEKQQQQSKGWFASLFSWPSSTSSHASSPAAAPRNPVAERLVSEGVEVLAKVASCLRAGVEFPALLASYVVASDASHAGVLADAGFGAAVVDVLAASNDTPAGPTLVTACAVLSTQSFPTLLVDAPDKQRALADAVFRCLTRHPLDSAAASSGFLVLQSLQGVGLDPVWLARKGAIPLAVQTLAWHGASDDVAPVVNDFISSILENRDAKEAVPDEQLAQLAQVLDMLANPEAYMTMSDEECELEANPESLVQEEA